MEISRRLFGQMLAGLTASGVFPVALAQASTRRLVVVSGVRDFTVAGFGTPKAAMVLLDGTVKLNLGAVMRDNDFAEGEVIVDGDARYAWTKGRWEDGTPEVLLNVEIPGV